jgi:hypothetical protein
MGEVALELIFRQMKTGHDELKAELAAMRPDIAISKKPFIHWRGGTLRSSALWLRCSATSPH